MGKVKTGMNNRSKKRVFVAMSGGVDSSVAALLLKKQGYDLAGVFMRCFNVDGCAEKDAEDARRVAEKLDIPFYVWDFEKEYKKKVVWYMVGGYRRGLTPNPDVMCNKEIKFGLFLKRALELGADFVATGHYVRITSANNESSTNLRIRKFEPNSLFVDGIRYSLMAARDSNKDQSYFLWTLTQKQLKHCLFPIGDYAKTEVRKIARKAGLPTADKKDSQGICFLGKVTLQDFLKTYIPEKRGEVLTASGDKIGEHSGAQFYTIGQRHIGIMNYESGIKGRRETRPYYVSEKDVRTNTLIVADGNDNPALYKKEIKLTDVNFISPVIHNSNFIIPVMARVRYRQPLASAHLRISANDESHTNKRIRGKFVNSRQIRYSLIFDKPQKFVAKGQSAVFYINEYPSSLSARSGRSSGELRMLGGGVII